MNSFMMSDVHLHEEAVKAPLAPTLCKSTGCACGTTAGDNRLLEELKSHSTAVAGRNSPATVVNQYFQAPTWTYILGDNVPSRITESQNSRGWKGPLWVI